MHLGFKRSNLSLVTFSVSILGFGAVTREAVRDRCDKRNTVLSQIGQVNLKYLKCELRPNAKCGQLRPTTPAVSSPIVGPLTI